MESLVTYVHLEQFVHKVHLLVNHVVQVRTALPKVLQIIRNALAVLQGLSVLVKSELESQDIAIQVTIVAAEQKLSRKALQLLAIMHLALLARKLPALVAPIQRIMRRGFAQHALQVITAQVQATLAPLHRAHQEIIVP